MKKHLLLWFVVISSCINALNSDQQKALKTLSAYSGTRTYLLSYPRSGNTWVRYCLEFLTRRATLTAQVDADDILNQPLAWRAGFDLDLTLPPIYKIHTQYELNAYKEADSQQEYLILIVRNPKEAITRHEGKVPDKEILQGKSIDPFYTAVEYFNNIRIYDSWNPERRLLLYYEDIDPATLL